MTKAEFDADVKRDWDRGMKDAAAKEAARPKECVECDKPLDRVHSDGLELCAKCRERHPHLRESIGDASKEALRRVEQNFKRLLEKSYKKADNKKINEELTDKTIKPSDKIKVARVLADMLGVEKAESMSPDQAVNMGLRKIKMKKMTPELIGILRKMLKLASDLGIKVDKTLIPKVVEESVSRKALKSRGVKFGDDEDEGLESAGDEDSNINIGTQFNNPGDGSVGGSGGNIIILPQKLKLSRGQQGQLNTQRNEYRIDDGLLLNFADFISEEKKAKRFDLSDAELDKIANSLKPEDLAEVYDDDEFSLFDEETGDETPFDQLEEQALNEILSRMQRQRARNRFKLTQGKRVRKLKIVLKQHSSPQTLSKRARRLAIRMIKERYMKKPLSKMTVAERERAERMLQQRKQLVDRLAVRLAPRMRKIETARLSHQKVKGKAISY